jgi:hypothetical protein
MESKANLGCMNKPTLESLDVGRFLYIGRIRFGTLILARYLQLVSEPTSPFVFLLLTGKYRQALLIGSKMA